MCLNAKIHTNSMYLITIIPCTPKSNDCYFLSRSYLFFLNIMNDEHLVSIILLFIAYFVLSKINLVFNLEFNLYFNKY